MNKKVSVCVTMFNEPQESVDKLLNALNNQTLKPDEIIIIDAKDYNNCSRSKGRNIAIKKANNEIIAITDAGAIPRKNWLQKLTDPFKNENVDVVSGFYNMVARNNFEKAEAVFLGVSGKNIDSDFLPSARSMAFTKTIWKKGGGFPESLYDTAEDTIFNLNLLNVGAKFVVAKNAVVDWYMPENIFLFMKKVKNYAKGDAQSRIWWHPVKKWQTHNIKVLTIFARYVFGIVLFLTNSALFYLYAILYTLYAFHKAGLWGIILQFVSDFTVMFGLLNGIINNLQNRM